jgi:hypothetical protein
MTIYKFTRLTVPPTLEKQREVLDAFRTLADQDDELLQWRRAEIAALRREAEDIRRCIDAISRQMLELRAQILTERKAQKYSPDQPRVPAGSPHGGEWTSEGGIGSSNGSPANAVTPAPPGPQRGPQYAQADTGTRTDGLVLIGDTVTPRGFSMEQVPAPDPLDPQRLNKPILSAEMAQVAVALSLIDQGADGALQPHVYRNFPHRDTGAVLPPPSAQGYTAYDVPGPGPGRGVQRLVIDKGTGAIYYTNNHYRSFYPVQLNQ